MGLGLKSPLQLDPPGRNSKPEKLPTTAKWIRLARPTSIGGIVPGKAREVDLSQRQRTILEKLSRARRTPAGLRERVRFVLTSAMAEPNEHQARQFGVDRQRVRRWRNRWVAADPGLRAAEEHGASDEDLKRLFREVLSDRPRSGGPTTFSPEQVTDIIALACENPSDSGLPVSHWTPAELAREVVRRGVVKSISPRQVDRFLKRSRAQTAQEPLLADFAGQAERPRAL